MSTSGLRGRWAQGLEPRNFMWVIRDRLGAGERPGGFARNHRKVRRQEELIWLSANGFTRVVSLLDSPHNLHAYEEAGLVPVHSPLGANDEFAARLAAVYAILDDLLADPAHKVFVHHEEFGDRLLGTLAGYLLHAGFVPLGPQAISIIEKLSTRSLDAGGREIVALTVAESL
ncbi:MAG: hypothetical protein ACKOBG_11085 [Actinomycetota bacterium]